jgi:hypothetical protein
MSKVKIVKRHKPKLYDYKPAERFAVVRKLPANRRYYCNFKMLYTDKAAAQTEALRLAKETGAAFYVIEVQSVTTNVLFVSEKDEQATIAD